MLSWSLYWFLDLLVTCGGRVAGRDNSFNWLCFLGISFYDEDATFTIMLEQTVLFFCSNVLEGFLIMFISYFIQGQFFSLTHWNILRNMYHTEKITATKTFYWRFKLSNKRYVCFTNIQYIQIYKIQEKLNDSTHRNILIIYRASAIEASLVSLELKNKAFHESGKILSSNNWRYKFWNADNEAIKPTHNKVKQNSLDAIKNNRVYLTFN